MNENTGLRDLADRRLAGLEWNEGRKQRVLNALDDERKGRVTMTARWKLLISLAVILALMSGAAIATWTIRYTPDANTSRVAVHALKEKYGLTDAALGLFWDPVAEEDGVWTLTLRNNLLVPDELTGVYTVSVEGESVTVAWTHDDADPADYASGALYCPIWGPPQMNYLATLSTEELTAQTRPYRTEKRKYASGPEIEIPVLTPAPDEIGEAEAIQTALAVLAETYGLDADAIPEDKISTLMTDLTLPQPSWYVYVKTSSSDVTYRVIINARTGEVFRIGVHMSTPR